MRRCEANLAKRGLSIRYTEILRDLRAVLRSMSDDEAACSVYRETYYAAVMAGCTDDMEN